MDDRFTKGNDGRLTITGVEAKDHGEYTCTMKGKDGLGERAQRKFVHLLVVFLIPNFNYFCTIKYGTSCDESFMGKKISHIKRALWEKNKYSLTHLKGNCHTVSDTKHQLWITFHIFPIENNHLPKCDATCMTKSVMDKLERQIKTVHHFVERETSREFNSSRIKGVYLKVKFQSPCPSGYRKDKDICTPCEPGSYSGDKDVACVLCPKGSYQPKFAMARCLECPGGSTTQDEGIVSLDKCKGPGVEGQKAVEVSAANKTAVGIGFAVLFLIMFAGFGFAVFMLYRNAQKGGSTRRNSKNGGGTKQKGSENRGKKTINRLSRSQDYEDEKLLLPKAKPRKSIHPFFTKKVGPKKAKTRQSKSGKTTRRAQHFSGNNNISSSQNFSPVTDQHGVHISLPVLYSSGGDSFDSEPIYMNPVPLEVSKDIVKISSRMHNDPSYARLGTPPPAPPPINTLPRLPDSVKSTKPLAASTQSLYATIDSVNMIKFSSHGVKPLDGMFYQSDNDIPPPLPPPRRPDWTCPPQSHYHELP